MKTFFVSLLLKSRGFSILSFTLFPISLDWISEKLQLDYMPFRMLGLILIFVGVDLITGLIGARIKKEKIVSKKGFQSVWKVIYYTLFLYVVSQMAHFPKVASNGTLVNMLEYIELSVFSLAIMWETHSWGENLEKIFGTKPRIFTFMDKISQAFEYLLVNKIKQLTKEDKDEKNNNKKDN